ncbi:RNA 2'-phosphotransferase [Taibaiella chishuiensis]|uniref:Tpt1/KptA family lRNA 2'-phosphotransferase n=1 Tax=Taibaiella chishuiensis TaxID=1434707 RepID=A0A2P8DAS4_9BACT|nr:RNA 2'-phosphotransferase [Taibaiella chishuiensis]PSK94318.1 Tpt1/KptA family lRNA 2'-phosphotransferase [Taibaiella chishuiensis]
MNEKELKTFSKFLGLVLRHSPQTIGLELDAEGWPMCPGGQAAGG